MALLRDIFIKKPKFSNFDLSRANRLTMAPGILYPVFVEETLPKDKWNISVSGLFKTYPLLAPLMGRFQVRVDFFYAPMSLYVKALRNDPANFDPSDILFPIKTYPVASSTSANVKVAYNTLATLLGMWPGGISGKSVSTPSDINMNAIPYLAYYDIFRNYYMNTQEVTCPVAAPLTEGSGGLAWAGMKTSTIGEEIDWILDNPGSRTNASGSPFDNPYLSGSGNFAKFDLFYSEPQDFNGLMLRTYKPDVNSAWLSSTNYETMITGARINIGSDDAFTINELRYANKLMKYNERGIVSGGRYSDWIKAEYGFNIQKWLDVPEYLGSTSCYLNFEDVVQTGGGSFEEDAGTLSTKSLGTLAGRGRGFMNGANHVFTTPENGYIMGIASIIPIPDYYQGSHSRYLKINFGDVYTPSLDRIGFQPKLKSELYAIGDPTGTWSKSGSNGLPGPFGEGVFYQPAWTEYMTATNELHGDFADPAALQYWVLARHFDVPANSGGSSSAEGFSYTSYIIPSMYNQCFADTSLTAENFQMQFAFDVKSHRAISKRLMPTL